MEDHELKCWPALFSATIAEVKTFEYRYDDRGLEVGDTLWLREWDPAVQNYTGRNARVLVKAVWKNIPGVPEKFCLMAIRLVQAPWMIIDEIEDHII